MTRSGQMGTPCECEQTNCHGGNGCHNAAVVQVNTIYGPFMMCVACAYMFPDKYRKGKDLHGE